MENMLLCLPRITFGRGAIAMELDQIDAQGDGLQLAASGRIIAGDLAPGEDYFCRKFGPEIYARKVIVDLSGCTFIDSSGISTLINSHKRFFQHGGMVVFHSLPPMIQQVLQMVRMQLVLHLAKDASAARHVIGGVE